MSTSTSKKTGDRTHIAQKLSKKWLTDPIKKKYVSGKEGDEKFVCIVCQESFSCESVYDHVKMHENKLNELKNLEPSQQTIDNLSIIDTQRQQYEFQVTKFILSNNLPFSITEPLVELFKKLKENDLIRQCNFSKLDRTRARTIATECFSEEIQEKLEEIMDNNFFHLIIDEVSDGYGNGYLGISIRYLNNNVPITQLYKLIKLEDNYTGEGICQMLEETILFSEVRKHHLISLITDGASNMCGEYKGVSSLLAKSVKHLFWLHCVSHCLNLILENAATNTMGDTVTLVKDISSTFAFSNANHSILSEIQDETDHKQKRILRYVPSRWLSLHKCIERILEEYEPLQNFFENQNTKDKEFFIYKAMNNKCTKPKLQFLHHIIEKVIVLNKLFQNDDATSYFLYQQLQVFFVNTCKMILKPEYRQDSNFDFSQLYSIDLTKDDIVNEYFMDSQECLNNFKRERFRTLIDWKNIPVDDELPLIEEFKEVILEILHQSKYYLPLDDTYINLFKVLTPDGYERDCWLSLAEKFPNLVPDKKFSQFIDELNYLETYKKELVKDEANIFNKWDIINEKSDIPIINNLAKTLLSIPVSSASLERVFSKLKLVKTHLRTQISDDTLESCLLVNQEKELALTESMIKVLDKIHNLSSNDLTANNSIKRKKDRRSVSKKKIESSTQVNSLIEGNQTFIVSEKKEEITNIRQVEELVSNKTQVLEDNRKDLGEELNRKIRVLSKKKGITDYFKPEQNSTILDSKTADEPPGSFFNTN